MRPTRKFSTPPPAHCEAILRLEGAGADEDVRLALARGLPVYYCLADVPGYMAD
ncbi:hypothetical protein [Hymenobacter psoromatis]|uniref:hypothetical protein n=1 Tax=Hymenobacter psoromatis TaxID=1484116 RepID=UPI001CBBE281|nr:hypothetical protein [Hymenobacter psoromatis]